MQQKIDEQTRELNTVLTPTPDAGARTRPRAGAPPAMEMPGMGMGMGGGGAPLDLRSLRTFESLKNPAFRLYFAATAGWFASMNVKQVARTLLIYRIGRPATVLGVMSLANAIPMFLFSLFGGVIADRVQKKTVL